MYNRLWVTSKCMNYNKSHYLEHLTSPESTLHQIDFYLILTLGSRSLGSAILLYYGIPLKKIIIIITIIITIIIIILIFLLLLLLLNYYYYYYYHYY